MQSLNDFLEHDFSKLQKGKSVIGKMAVRQWSNILRKCMPGNFESWAMAMFYCVTGNPSPPQDTAHYNKSDYQEQAAMSFWENLEKNSAKLEKFPLWKEFCQAQGPENKMEALLRFMNKAVDLWRNDCIEIWRRKPGTFAYTHRRLQKILREKLPASSWCLYDPKSRFYGPCSLPEPIERLDIKNSQILKEISKPPNAPDSGKIYYAEHAVNLAKWIYNALPNSSKNKSQVLATRNFARWLCFQYPGLLTWEVMPDYEKAVPASYMEEDVKIAAQKAAFSLTPIQRQIMALKNNGKTLEEIMRETKLANISQVSRELEKAIKIVHEITLESIAIEGGDDSDSPYSMSNQENAREAFMRNFISFCEKGEAYA